jgi:filamentous hemagglutinin
MEQHGSFLVQAERFSVKISKLFNILITILFLPVGVLFFNRRKIIAYFLSFSLLFSQTAWAYNDIVPPQNIVDNPIKHIEIDPDRAGNTHLDRAQNGTPMVNINAASNGGVSANYYRDFNVNEENLILNNHKGDAELSKLGGALYGNPNFNALGAKAADIILNEVTSSRVTNLNGYTEIFGKQAELIIANPNGIMVGGAGFINTSRLSMITGQSGGLDANGKLNPFLLSESPNAIITIIGRDIVDKDGNPVAYNLGIDMSGGQYVDLLSRVAQINGKILSGGAVNIKTGNDKAIRGADGEWAVSSTDKADKPEFSIDSTALGGIYAGRISLIASEDGVGVRTRGDLVASVDGIKFDTKGNITIDGYAASNKNIDMKSTDGISANGEIVAERNITANAGGDIYLHGQTSAKNDLTANAGGDMSLAGEMSIGGNAEFLATGKLTDNSEAIIGGTATYHAGGAVQQTGILSALGISVAGASLENSAVLQSETGVSYDIAGNAELGSDSELLANGDISIMSGNLKLYGLIHSIGNIDFTTTDLNNYGLITSEKDFTATSESFTNSGQIKSVHDLGISALTIQNLGLIATSAGNMNLNITDSLMNFGEIHSGGNLILAALNINNADGKLIADKTLSMTMKGLNNTGGELLAVDDLTLTFSNGASWDIVGKLQAGGTLTFNGENITNGTGDVSAKNLVLNAEGDFVNGSSVYENVLNVTNNLILNIDGDLVNYGAIKVGNDATITSGGSIYNGVELGSNAIIHAGGNLVMTAATRILNKGFLQAIGQMILKSLADTNGDYDLNKNFEELAASTVSGNMESTYQTQYNNLANITNFEILTTLAENVKTPEQYKAVQERIRYLMIQEELDGYIEFDGTDVASLSEPELLKTMEAFLDKDYDPEDWQVYVSDEAISDIDDRIASQQKRCDDYNEERGTELTRFEYADLEEEEFLDRDMLIVEATAKAEAERDEYAQSIIDERVALAKSYKSTDWASMEDDDVADKMADLLESNFYAPDWYLPKMPVSLVEAAITKYISSLRIAGINLGKVEKTGIHNDGRVYSGGDMTLISNSVLHNNKGALIYSGGNADFQVADVLFNNANAEGQGIFVNGVLRINGIDGVRLSQLVNYNGSIESNGNLSIDAKETINYGEDKTNLSSNYVFTNKHERDKQDNENVRTDIQEVNWKAGYMPSDSSTIRSNGGTLSIVSDSTTNYNSLMLGYDIDIETSNLLNKSLALNITITEYWVNRHDRCKRKLGVCYKKVWVDDYYTKLSIAILNGKSPSKITAVRNLDVKANKIGNGAYTKESIGKGAKKPADPASLPETPLQEIVRTGAIDPLANFKLPTGKYGTIRQGETLDIGFLYETDQLLVDLSLYLGSAYFMNRIGVDPHDVETRFMGDAFVEHEIIKKSLEQIRDFQNNFSSDAEIDAYIKNMYNALTPEVVMVLGLQFGEPLTSEQIENLDKDIVWYVKQTVTLPNGEKVEVLVPQVYLCQATLDELYSAALAREDTQTSIRGDSVTIEALDKEVQSVLDNSGMIVGNRELIISTDEINNAATTIGSQAPVLRGGDLLVLNTGGGGVVNNIGGTIETTNADSMLAINTGELNNITLTQQETTTGKNYKKVDTYIGETATISSAGNMSITTSGDLTMAGSKISAVGDSELDVGHDLESLAIQDYSYEYSKTKKSGLLSSKTTTTEKESIKNIGSEISVGGSLKMDVAGDATFAGTKIDVGGSADIDVEGDTNIIAVVDSEYSHSETKKSSWGGLVKEKDIVTDSSQRLQGASVSVQEGLTLNTGKNLNLLASDVNVGGNADMSAGNNINIMSADEVSTHYELHEKTSYLAGLSLDAGCKGGKCSADLTIGKKTTDTNQTTTSNAIGSALNVGGNLSLDAGNDINIHGSDITISGKGTISAGNNINVTAAQDSSSSSTSHEDTEIKVGVSGGNAYYDTALTVKAVYEAEQAVEKATKILNELQATREKDLETRQKDLEVAEAKVRDLEEKFQAGEATKKELNSAKKELEKLHNGAEASDAAIAGAAANVAIATSNLAMATLAAANSVAQSAAATPLYGFYGSVGMSMDTKTQQNQSSQTTAVASNVVSGGNLVFSAGKNMTQIGSNAASTDGDILYDIANDLTIRAAENTSDFADSTSHFSASVNWGTNGVSGKAGHDESESSGISTYYTNATTTAENGKITYKVGGDMNAAGYNALAKDVEIDVDGDFTLASLQNTSSSDNSSWGVNAGIGGGSANIGGSVGNGGSDRKWTDSVSSIVGTESVDVDVAGNTHLTGSVIANIDEEGNDKGNLTMKTGSLTYTDLEDTESNSQTGFSVSVSGHNPLGANDGKPKGETNIGMTNTGSEKEGMTYATIGKGSITVGGVELEDDDNMLAGLNRDIDNVQELTKNELTGALDANLTINHAAFDAQTWQNLVDLPENALTAADNARVSAHLLGEQMTIGLVDNLSKNWDDPTAILDEIVADFNRGDKQNQLYQTTESKDSVRLMWKFDENKSVSDNVQDILKSETSLLDASQKQTLTDLLALGADDNNLLGTLVSPLYSEFVQSGVVLPTSSSGLVNPMNTLADYFDFTLEERKSIATVAGLPRSTEYGGCNNTGCGDYLGRDGAHKGQDINANPGDLVFAPTDGDITRIGVPYSPSPNNPDPNGNLKTITITDKDNNTESKTFYVQPGNGINKGSEVNQGDVIGTVQDLRKESPIKHDNPNDPAGRTPYHSHQELKVDGEQKDPSISLYPRR